MTNTEIVQTAADAAIMVGDRVNFYTASRSGRSALKIGTVTGTHENRGTWLSITDADGRVSSVRKKCVTLSV